MLMGMPCKTEKPYCSKRSSETIKQGFRRPFATFVTSG
ncbi:hypothetical protein MCC93_11200 [Morococcus cerebrosus]|uniref:Uncharacterized protein n=1 Tax=Morococcus cerebrosus TaxID=1056807 RepID=A0A0C1E9F0_9NEIS|nr:hypothetical protein MCC93_11200 [Morococcus cerebrosus]